MYELTFSMVGKKAINAILLYGRGSTYQQDCRQVWYQQRQCHFPCMEEGQQDQHINRNDSLLGGFKKKKSFQYLEEGQQINRIQHVDLVLVWSQI